MVLKFLFDRIFSFIGLLIPMACIADCGYIGKGDDAGRSCVLCAEESGQGRQIV